MGARFCPLPSSREFRKLVIDTGLHPEVVYAIVSDYMHKNNTFEYPSKEEVFAEYRNIKGIKVPSIKDLAIRYNMSETGFFSKYITVEHLKRELEIYGLPYTVKQTSNGNGYYREDKRGKKLNLYRSK